MTLRVLSGPPPDYVFVYMTKESIPIYQANKDCKIGFGGIPHFFFRGIHLLGPNLATIFAAALGLNSSARSRRAKTTSDSGSTGAGGRIGV